MKNRSEFSVIISLYDKESEDNFLKSLTSVFNQTLIPAEVVLVIDGPVRQKLLDIISSFAAYNMKVLTLPENIGLGRALNAGLNACSYEIIARMDTDDICYSNRFEKQMDHMIANPHVSVLGTAVQEFNFIPGDLNRFRKLPTDYKALMKFARYRNPLNHPSVFFRKSHIISVGSYLHMPMFEDYFLWMRVLKNGFIIENLDESLLHFRVGNDMIGRRHGYNYLKHELSFLNSSREINFLSYSTYLKAIISKLPLRLLPKPLLGIIYKSLLR